MENSCQFDLYQRLQPFLKAHQYLLGQSLHDELTYDGVGVVQVSFFPPNDDDEILDELVPLDEQLRLNVKRYPEFPLVFLRVKFLQCFPLTLAYK